MLRTACLVFRSTTETVPVVEAPVSGSATIGVPEEGTVKSLLFAIRPPSFVT